jgi:hypothetical protein
MADCDSEQALEYGDLSPLLDRVEKLRQVKAATSRSTPCLASPIC